MENWVRLWRDPLMQKKLEDFAADSSDKIGWCLVCNQPIPSEEHLIPGTSVHACPENLAQHHEKPFEEPTEI